MLVSERLDTYTRKTNLTCDTDTKVVDSRPQLWQPRYGRAWFSLTVGPAECLRNRASGFRRENLVSSRARNPTVASSGQGMMDRRRDKNLRPGMQCDDESRESAPAIRSRGQSRWTLRSRGPIKGSASLVPTTTIKGSESLVPTIKGSASLVPATEGRRPTTRSASPPRIAVR